MPTHNEADTTEQNAGSEPCEPAGEIVRKAFSLKDAQIGLNGNRISGYAAAMGNMDAGGDVIFPGAFKGGVLTRFLQRGFVPVGHDWYSLPVAMPVTAKEEGNRLLTEAEFHTTPTAQEARTVARERIERGLEVGLSIGFDIEQGQMFDSGAELLEFAEGSKQDMSLFDVARIAAYKGICRAITKVRELYEYSIVSVPMNSLAVATAAKARLTAEYDFDALQTERDFERTLREAGFSQKAAALYMHAIKAKLLQREAEGAIETEEPEEAAEPPVPPIIAPPVKRLVFTAAGRVIQCPL